MKTLLWLDDYRDPLDKQTDWMAFSPIGRNVNVVWVTSFKEFVDYITINGLPDGICFDHDLGFTNEYYVENGLDSPEVEENGYDCAKWLVDYCIDNNKNLPSYNIQSANPVGKENIDKYLKSFISFTSMVNGQGKEI